MANRGSGQQVVTYQSPGEGRRVSLCRECEDRLRAEGAWPRDGHGVECCQVYMGRHYSQAGCEACRGDE